MVGYDFHNCNKLKSVTPVWEPLQLAFIEFPKDFWLDMLLCLNVCIPLDYFKMMMPTKLLKRVLKIHCKAKSLWTSDYHTHMCLLNIPIQILVPLCCNILYSSWNGLGMAVGICSFRALERSGADVGRGHQAFWFIPKVFSGIHLISFSLTFANHVFMDSEIVMLHLLLKSHASCNSFF